MGLMDRRIDIVKISKKYLPQTCSRSARVWWLRSIFSISYNGRNDGGTVIYKTGIGAVFDLVS